MDIEGAFNVVGKFGRFQSYCFLIFCLCQVFLALQMVLMTIIGATPEKITNSRGKIESDSNTIISEWGLFERTEVSSFIQSLFMFGVLIGNLVFGSLADTYGRKKICNKALFLFTFTSFLTTFANNYVALGIIRFFVGIFLGGVGLISFVQCQELLGSSVWTISGCVLPAFFAIGISILAGIGSSVSDWRNVCLITSLPGFLLCLAYIPVPESPRWLYSRGKVTEAEDVMKFLAAKNGIQCRTLTLKPKPNMDDKKKGGKSYGMLSLFSPRPLMIRTLVMGFVWFTCSFVYYGLTMNAGSLSSDRFTSLALIGIVELPALFLCGFVITQPWAGRKRSLIGSLLVAGVSCAGVMFTDTTEAVSGPKDDSPDDTPDTGAWSAKLVLALIGKLAIAFAFTTIYIYASELFPTVVRNVGMGSSSVCARIGGILAPLVPTLATISPPLPFVVFGACCFIAVCTCFAIPETLNCQIPDTIEDLTATASKTSGYKRLAVAEDAEVGLRDDKARLLPDDDTSV